MPSRQKPDQQQREAAVVAAIIATQQQSAALRESLAAYVQRLWRSLGAYRDADMRRFVAEIVPVVAGAQQRMAALTAASLAEQKHAALGVPFRPVALDDRKVIGAAVRNGTPPAEVYERPFHLVWRELAELPREDASIDKAIQSGLDRATNLALTDVQLTKQHAALQIMGHDDKAIGVRRVLEGTYSCALCIVASTLRYRLDAFRERGNKMRAIHPACDCSWVIIYDPSELHDNGRGFSLDSRVQLGDGRIVSVGELPDVHDKIAETFGRADAGARGFGVAGSRGKEIAYRDVLVTHEHGELGDVLAVRGQHFLGPSDIPRHKRRPKVA